MPGFACHLISPQDPHEAFLGHLILKFCYRSRMRTAVTFMMLHVVLSSFGVLGFFTIYSTAIGLVGVTMSRSLVAEFVSAVTVGLPTPGLHVVVCSLVE